MRCPNCGNTAGIMPCGCCGAKKFKCPKCKYRGPRRRFQ